MPKRTDIKKILIVGSGPIIIGQACEFDYSGTQACKALVSEGYEVVLFNSNPATIMTDPEMAHKTYVEPVTPEVLVKILEKERPDAVLGTLGGQTGINVTISAYESGDLDRLGVEMIGADYNAMKKAEDREEFKAAMVKIGLDVPRSWAVRNMDDARKAIKDIGFPAIIRASFTLGGTGGSTVYNMEEFEAACELGMQYSMINEILIEESVLGWKEYELEVMRDHQDNVVIICSIENIDPMGVHTGDSITVAPAQTLTDVEYQIMRDASLKVIREIGVDTGGSNIQFAVNPGTGRMTVIEMNPRVSRSSALASKATGFPIAKIAALLAVGYTLDEIPNDITQKTPASFEPTIDYCVTKIPRFTFEKFPNTDDTLGVSMKSVGEAMSIGRTFKESFQKGLRSLETGLSGLDLKCEQGIRDEDIRSMLSRPNCMRLFYVKRAFKAGYTVADIAGLSGIDPWFLNNIREIIDVENEIAAAGSNMPEALLEKSKRYGFSDRQIAELTDRTEEDVRSDREERGLYPVYRLVDTCAAEFEAYTPYYYSTYESETENPPSDRKKVMIIGGGPNRIGQGIEFDYCCVQASMALREAGYETIMVNSNPETVSTDYDISDRLYFEPLTLEDILNIYRVEKPEGLIVQFGGQTPISLAVPLAKNNVPILGTSPEQIDRAEDRRSFREILQKLDLKQPESDTALSVEEGKKIAKKIGFPVMVRPSYVLGGRAMEIVWDEDQFDHFARQAVIASGEHPILIDKFLSDAIEVDIDVVADGKQAIVGGILEHIEHAGIHSGDSAMVIPAFSLDQKVVEEIKDLSRRMALELEVKGLMNIQVAVKDGEIYIIEVNPRASRTVPFISKSSNFSMAKIASRVMVGMSLENQGITEDPTPRLFSVKESVLPFSRFPQADAILGPEMKSTGEVMGRDETFGMAFAKSQIAAGQALPREGAVFISVKDRDKDSIVAVASSLSEMGFTLYSTTGTSKILKENGVSVSTVMRISEGRPNILDLMKNKEISLLINTPSGPKPSKDEVKMRTEAVAHGISLITTVAGAEAAAEGISAMKSKGLAVRALQETS